MSQNEFFKSTLSFFNQLRREEPKNHKFDIKKTITKSLKKTTVSVGGRHDPCVGIRAVPIGEAMLACVLADHFLRNKVFQS